MLTYGSDEVEKFDWSLDFAEVFADGGFDIVVANPPYVRQELIKHLKPTLKKVYPEIYTGTADLYCFFYARALELLREGGMLAFISSNKWMRNKYGEKLRKHIANKYQVQNITDFGELPVFRSAATFPMIFIAQNQGTSDNICLFTQVSSLKPPYPDVKEIIMQNGQILPDSALNSSDWILADISSANRLQKMESSGIPLGEYVKGKIFYGIKTGFNKAFVIDGTKRTELIAQDSKSTEIIKPLAVGDNIRKWHLRIKNKWLIVTPIGINMERYPAIFEHLEQWQDKLEKRYDQDNYWWELRACKYYDEFDKPKIIFPDIAKESRFTFDNAGTYLGNTAYMIPLHDFFLLGVLNSDSVWRYAKNKFRCLGDPNKGGRFRFINQSVVNIPIPQASNSEKEAISKLVQKCLDAKGVNCEAWEKEIDDRVAALYGL